MTQVFLEQQRRLLDRQLLASSSGVGTSPAEALRAD